MISGRVNGRANHCMLFFTKICIALHSIKRARSIARCTPPAIDTWAPRRIADLRLLIVDFRNQKSAVGNSSKPFWAPDRLRETAFAMVFEELVEWRQDRPRARRVDPNVEVEFVPKEIDIAVSQHGK